MTNLLLVATASYIFGICWYYTPGISISYAIGLLALLAAFYLLKPLQLYYPHTGARTIFFSLCFVSFFVICGVYRIRQQHTYHLHMTNHLSESTGQLYGTIVDIQESSTDKWPYRVTIDVDAFMAQDRYTPCATRIWIYTKYVYGLQIADRCLWNSIQFKTKNDTAFNQYLIKEGVCASLFVPKLSYTRISRQTVSVKKKLFYTRKHLYNSLKKRMSPGLFALYAKIFLGSKSDTQFTQSIKEHFKLWGLSHQLARSGLHMTLCAGLWFFLVRLIPLPFTYKQLLLLLLSCIYFLLTWSSIPFNRAFLTFIVQKIGILLSLSADFLHILTLICLGTLLVNPIQLFFLDFQLSFGLTYAIAFLNRIYQAK